jgi:hypothetical protein
MENPRPRQRGEDESTDLEPWLAPLREQFPAPTPIDEE